MTISRSIALLAASTILASTLAACGSGTASSSSSQDVSTSDPAQSTSSAPAVESSSDSGTTTAASNSSFANGVLDTPDATITITQVKKIAVGEPGNEYGDAPVIAFWYDVTNKSGKDMDPSSQWLFSITAYQDNNPNAENKLEVGMLPDQAFLDTQLEKIKQGGTVSNAMAYVLTDETTPVDLVASADFGMTEIGRQSYPLQ
ncbi:DUF5067 domain-containing protein [Actinomyces culturomici]|uniref:DUF5067 domain-containing protein n=1 Tax=Actinomyces culturomici TaxID=1926276 RepID=UPI000E206BA3|nr:DUF5067 domain-containing protein [Actinomyces culturomici]